MTRSVGSACVALAIAAAFAAGCATDTPSADSQPAAASASGTPARSAGSVATKNSPDQRAGSPGGAQPALKNMPAQRTVYYDFDRADIKPEFRPAIEAHARYLRDNADARVTIEGNGDERGSREYNLALGQKRAEGVRQTLRLLGATDQQIEAVSYGEEKPKALGHDEASWAQNRRSDFVYRRGE